jgi:hypothetical protein
MNLYHSVPGKPFLRKETAAVTKARRDLAYSSSYHAVPPGFCIPDAPNKAVRCKELPKPRRESSRTKKG